MGGTENDFGHNKIRYQKLATNNQTYHYDGEIIKNHIRLCNSNDIVR